MSRLRVGVMLSVFGWASPQDVRPFARHVEQLGLDSVFVGDHLISVRPLLDSVVTLAAVAAVTERIRVGFGVMVVPLRHPAWVAKQVASLQHLSGDRVILGVGSGGRVHGMAGWDAVGVPYAVAASRLDGALDVLPRLIAGEPAPIGPGGPVTLAPGAEVPPIWIGGGSPAALRRAVEHNAVWFPAMVPPFVVAQGARRLAELASECGRPVPAIAVGVVMEGVGTPPAAHEGLMSGLVHGYGVAPEVAAMLPITGDASKVAERFVQYEEAGAEHLVVNLVGGDWRTQCEVIAEARALMA